MDRHESVKVDSDNIHSKYSRLCAEFKKLRENHTVLKQALLEERDQRAILQVKLRDADIRIRQFDQERESLNFRNVHLSKQVEYLQMQLEAERQQSSHKKNAAASVKRGDHHTEGKGDYTMLLERDLEKRIAECAELHSRMADLTRDHEQSRTVLQKQIHSLEQEMSRKLEEHRKAMQRHQSELENARDEKAALEVKVILLEREAHKLQEKMSEPTISDSNAASPHEMTPHQNSEAETTPLSTLRESDLHYLHGLKAKLKTCFSLWKDCLSQWQHCCQGGDTNWSQICSLTDNLAACVEQLQVYSLIDGKTYELFFDSVSSIAFSLLHFAQCVKESFSPAIRTYFDKELTSLIPDLETQGRLYNADILNSLHNIADALSKVGKLISVPFNDPSSDAIIEPSHESSEHLFKALEHLPLAVKKLSRAITNKASLIEETGSPDASNISQQYKALSEAFLSLKKELSNILSILQSNCITIQFLLSVCDKRSPFHPSRYTVGRGSPISQDSATASIISTNNSLCGLLIPQSASTPQFSSTGTNIFNDTISNAATPSANDCNTTEALQTAPDQCATSVPSNNRHSQQISAHSGTRRVPNGGHHGNHTEEDHWSGISMSEVSDRSSPYFLSPIHKGNVPVGVENWEKRLTLLLDRVASLEAKANESSVTAQIALHRLAESFKVRQFFESLLKQHGVKFNIPEEESSELLIANSTSIVLERARPLHIPGQLEEESLRERLLSQHFHSRCSELHSHLELTQSHLHHYQAECYNLQARLKIEESQKVKLTEVIEKLNLEISRVKEDLECTQENYASNISQMTDHISSLNKQLTEQDQRLDQYKAQAQSKKLIFSLKK